MMFCSKSLTLTKHFCAVLTLSLLSLLAACSSDSGPNYYVAVDADEASKEATLSIAATLHKNESQFSFITKVIKAACYDSANGLGELPADPDKDSNTQDKESPGADCILYEKGFDESGPFTVFAPNDQAFTLYLSEQNIREEAFLDDRELLISILRNHILESSTDTKDLRESAHSHTNTIKPLNKNADLTLSITENNRAQDLYINTAKVVNENKQASNGIIHAIDKVIELPSDDPRSDPNKTIAGLLNHLDTNTSNELSAITKALNAPKATELLEKLNDSSLSYTLFAPNDQAFIDLKNGPYGLSAAALIASSQLVPTLQKHVSMPEYNLQELRALNGETLPQEASTGIFAIELRDGELFVQDAQVITSDIIASNGVIHVIDQVFFNK